MYAQDTSTNNPFGELLEFGVTICCAGAEALTRKSFLSSECPTSDTPFFQRVAQLADARGKCVRSIPQCCETTGLSIGEIEARIETFGSACHGVLLDVEALRLRRQEHMSRTNRRSSEKVDVLSEMTELELSVCRDSLSQLSKALGPIDNLRILMEAPQSPTANCPAHKDGKAGRPEGNQPHGRPHTSERDAAITRESGEYGFDDEIRTLEQLKLVAGREADIIKLMYHEGWHSMSRIASRGEIANRVKAGLTAQSLNRAFGRLRGRGLIEVTGRGRNAGTYLTKEGVAMAQLLSGSPQNKCVPCK